MLRDRVVDLRDAVVDHVVVSSLPGVESDGRVLRFVISAADEGVVRCDGLKLECRLTSVRWGDVTEILEPFCLGGSGFQWLAETGEISLLITPSGLF